MILDTSAICAVAFNEPQAPACIAAIDADDSLAVSAATMVELAAVLKRSCPPQYQRRVERLLEAWGVQVVAFDAVQADIARRAYQDFGRGSGHPAALNLGDCYSYALAIVMGEPLLFVGDDFQHTDVDLALEL